MVALEARKPTGCPELWSALVREEQRERTPLMSKDRRLALAYLIGPRV